MRPFFSYYGAKWNSAKHYGAPRRGLVIEPFAGSACYSTYWGAPQVKLYDISEEVCSVWDFLINCTDRDIEALPDFFRDNSELGSLPYAQRNLCGWWVAKARPRPSCAMSLWGLNPQFTSSTSARVWGPAVKGRILAQKPLIAGWTVGRASWEDVPITEAHWHIDPPYSGKAGRRYPHTDIDYAALSVWARSLPGAVDVCENYGADWLPFAPSHQVQSASRSAKKSVEVTWSR